MTINQILELADKICEKVTKLNENVGVGYELSCLGTDVEKSDVIKIIFYNKNCYKEVFADGMGKDIIYLLDNGIILPLGIEESKGNMIERITTHRDFVIRQIEQNKVPLLTCSKEDFQKVVLGEITPDEIINNKPNDSDADA